MGARRNGAVLAIAVVLVLGFVTDVFARVEKVRTFGDWTMYQQIFDDKTEGCIAIRDYDTGISLGLGFSDFYTPQIWLVIEDWKLADYSFDGFQLVVDDTQTLTIDSKPYSDTVIFRLYEREKDLEALLGGSTLSIISQSKSHEFDIGDAGILMRLVFECVSEAVKQRYENEFDEPVLYRADRLFITDVLIRNGLFYQLLSATFDNEVLGLTDYKLIEGNSLIDSVVNEDLAWTGNGCFGMGSELPVEGNTVADLVSEFVSDMDEECPGEFSLRELDGVEFPVGAYSHSIMFQCQAPEKKFSAVHSLLPVGKTMFRIMHMEAGITDLPIEADNRLTTAMIALMEAVMGDAE